MFKLGLLLIFCGFALAFIATIFPLLTFEWNATNLSVTGGGCIIIGFIPVCFGVGEYPIHILIVVLSIALALVLIGAIFSFHILREARKYATQTA